MRWLAIACMLALGAGFGYAQDDDCCSAKEILCPLKGECKDQCRTVCDNVGEAVKAAKKKTAELLKERLTKVTSNCVSGDCTYASRGCPCGSINEKTYNPIVKDLVSVRFKAMKARKKVHHTVKVEGKKKAEKVECSFPFKSCDHCVLDMAKVAAKKLGKMFAKK